LVRKNTVTSSSVGGAISSSTPGLLPKRNDAHSRQSLTPEYLPPLRENRGSVGGCFNAQQWLGIVLLKRGREEALLAEYRVALTQIKLPGFVASGHVALL
jgi:hypothetical protein